MVTEANGRLFVASELDVAGMQAAYYAAPVNTYWHRLGPELPARQYLRPGDFILVLFPSKISYNRKVGRIRYIDGVEIAVTERLSSELGVLLEVSG